ncbi:ATP-grasp domain-containing protein [Krasilnikovia sp. MM14-A1259]|uniref:ATP-grasp domain-containing protein n=1 Tax=Krasilnikovia sp. MM14-A1259 TaxID=3373539 RepID=UPI00382F6683
MKHRVLMVGGGRDTLLYGRELGVDIVLVNEPGRYDPDWARYCETVLHAPVADSAAIVDVVAPLHRQRPFERVISPGELGLVSAAEVAEALGIPGNSARTARLLKDKSLTRAMLNERGLGAVRYRVVGSADELRRFQADLGGPVILKPVAEAASLHVHLVTDAADVEAAWAAQVAAGYDRALAEEQLVGPEVSVESFSLDGRHLLVAVNAKTLNATFVETGHTVPGPATGDPELLALAAKVLDAAGIVEGPAHTEFVLTAHGPRVLESHNRMGGGGIRELVRRVYGLNFSRMTLSVPLGLEPLPIAVSPTGAAAIRFLIPPPGTVAAIEGPPDGAVAVRRTAPGEQVFGIPGLEELSGAQVGVQFQMNPGDVVPAVRSSLDKRMGYVIASGVDAVDAAHRCEQVMKAIRFDTVPTPEQQES